MEEIETAFPMDIKSNVTITTPPPLRLSQLPTSLTYRI